MGNGALTQHSLAVNGVARTYFHYSPSLRQPGEVLPLLFAMHGGGGSADGFTRKNGFLDAAEDLGFVIVAPQGLGDSPAWRHTDDPDALTPKARREAGDDVAFFAALHAEVLPSLGVSKLFGAGVSAGGMMLYRVAGQRPGGMKLHAFGVCSSTMTIAPSLAPGADGTHLIHLHGTSDDRVPFDGGGNGMFSGVVYPPVMDGIDHWVAANGAPPLARQPNPASGWREDATVSPDGVRVALRRKTGGEHQWYPEATDMVLDFFRSTV